MAAIRHALQRDVFTSKDERLLGVVHVTKNGKSKSKKNNFLCLAVTSEQPVQVYICVVKKGSRKVSRDKMSQKNDSLLQIIDHPYQDLMNHTKDTFNGR